METKTEMREKEYCEDTLVFGWICVKATTLTTSVLYGVLHMCAWVDVGVLIHACRCGGQRWVLEYFLPSLFYLIFESLLSHASSLIQLNWLGREPPSSSSL